MDRIGPTLAGRRYPVHPVERCSCLTERVYPHPSGEPASPGRGYGTCTPHPSGEPASPGRSPELRNVHPPPSGEPLDRSHVDDGVNGEAVGPVGFLLEQEPGMIKAGQHAFVGGAFFFRTVDSDFHPLPDERLDRFIHRSILLPSSDDCHFSLPMNQKGPGGMPEPGDGHDWIRTSDLFGVNEAFTAPD